MDYLNRFDGVIKLGDHLVLLYDSESSITDTVVAYISNSLLNNQKFIYITGDTDVKMIQEKLKELELFNSYVESRQLVFLNQNEAYSKEGRFNPESMKELLKILTIEAQTDGFEGLAISGEISWVLEYDKGFDLINEYEWKINSEVFGVFPVTALCRYNMDRFSDEMIINVIQLHPFLILNNKVYENPFYIPAIAYETNNIPKYQVKTWLENIVKFSSTKSEFNQRLEEKDLKVFELKNLLEISLDSAENVIMISLDKEYKYMYFNKAHYNDMKNAYNMKVKIGECIFDYMTSEEDIKKIKANYDIALSGKHHTSLEVYGDIEANYYETRFNPIYDLEGNVTGLTIFSSNVTERTQLSNSLKESMKQNSALINAIPDILFILDRGGIILDYRAQESELLYEEPEIFIGKKMQDVLPIDIGLKFESQFKKLNKTSDILTIDYSLFINDETRYYEARSIQSGSNQIVCIVRDITDIKEKELELEKSEQNLKSAQKLGKIGSWELDLETNVLWASEQAYATYSLDRTDGLMAESTAMDLIIEEDREIMAKALKELTESGKPYDVVVRVKTMLDELKYVNSKGYLEVDKNKKPVKVVGTSQDITELKEKELALETMAFTDYLTGLSNRRKFEEKLIELDVAENLPITIVMADINGLKLINDAFGHLSGDELLKSAADLISSKCSDTDIVSRIGGDEFAIIMAKTNPTSAEKIIKEINMEAKSILTQSIPLSISFGFKSKTHKDDNIYEVLRSAEDLMYREKLLEIPSMRSGAIETILNTLYEKDVQSEVHSRTVSDLSERLAKAYGMDRQDVAEVKTAGLLHDIGKIIIPLSIINKEGKLTKEEYSTMKNHPEIGFRILNSSQDMRGISNIVLNHHERWDGGGYPRGIMADKIPLKSRIISITDAFDAMTSERKYKKTISKEEALQELLDHSGTQFDPELVKIFKENFVKITE